MMNARELTLATDGERPERSADPRSVLPRWWPLFVTTWLAFVVIGPVAAMLAPPLTPMRALATLAWTVAFFAAYLWLMLHKPFRGAAPTAIERRIQIGLLLVLTLLILAVDIAFPSGWFWLFIFVVMPAGLVLPPRAAVGTIVAVTLLAMGVEGARSEWSLVPSIPGIAIWGVATIMLRRLVATIEELRAARAELARLAVAEERLRFARDLHDLLGHSLSLIALKSELARRILPTESERAAAEIGDVERMARQALREARETVAGYRQPTLARELAGVRDLLAAAGIEATIESYPGPLPPGIDAVLAWTVREGGTNVVRHSRAHHCWIRLSQEHDAVRADVADDGRGPTDAVNGDAGAGLAGLAERVADASGHMEAGPGPDGGFRLSVIVPLVEDDGRTAACGADAMAGDPER